MANLYWKVKTYLEANGKTEDVFTNGNVTLKNIGDGDFIETWNVSGLAQPTDVVHTLLNGMSQKHSQPKNNSTHWMHKLQL